MRLWQQSRDVLAPVGEAGRRCRRGQPNRTTTVLGYLQKTARERRNVFEALMER